MEVKIDTAKLDRIIATMPTEAKRTVWKGAFLVEAYAKTLAPVDTGALRAGIHTEPTDDDLAVIVGDAVEYGIYQEFGTYKMAAQPFMIPAVERAQPQYTKMWRELFNRL